MLIQLPRGSHAAPARNTNEDEDFEAGLRRDLASSPLVSYDATLGGWQKRTADVLLSVVSAPAWLPVLALAAAWAKARGVTPVFVAPERVGYGGRVFPCFGLQLSPRSAVVTVLHSEAEQSGAPVSVASTRGAWTRALEALPQLFNVLRGEMSLVGPRPLSREQLDPLKTAKRYYLSARPGVVGVNVVLETQPDDPSQYKLYALSWSLLTDALIVWEALTVKADVSQHQQSGALKARNTDVDAA